MIKYFVKIKNDFNNNEMKLVKKNHYIVLKLMLGKD